jgi:hypothetical protein
VRFERGEEEDKVKGGGRARVRVRVPFGTTGTVLLPGVGTVVEVRREGWDERRRVRRTGPSVELDHGTYDVEIAF